MTRNNDDVIRILKEVCGSARYLIATAAANNLKPPYRVTKGTSLHIPCWVSNVQTTSTTRRTTTDAGNEIERFFNRFKYLFIIIILNHLIKERR